MASSLVACHAPPTGCTIEAARVELPGSVRESSGAAWSRARPGTWWTINDDGAPALFAFDSTGRRVARVRVAGATNRDWEDLAIAPCGDAPGDCLWIADIGDNDAVHGDVVLYRVPEPAAGDTITAPAVRVVARYADGPRDAEAFAVVPGVDGRPELLVISKGRRTPITLYATPWRTDTALVLRPVRTLAAQPDDGVDRVTGAGASPDGRWVAVRSYGTLAIWARDSLRGTGGPSLRASLGALRESQGEAVALSGDGRVLVTSEGDPARFSVLRCPVR